MKKKEEVKEQLLKLVDKIGAEIKDFPWEDPTAYIHWLAQTYFIVRHTTCFLALSASRWGVKNRVKQYQALAHLREESSHDSLALNDLEKMGVFIDHHKEWPETQAFYQTQYYWIEHETPAAHLGYAYLLEGVACKMAGTAYQKIKKTHGEKCGTFMRVHAEEDPHHFEDGLKILNNLNDHELDAFLDCLNQSAFLYSAILAKMKSRAFGFAGVETIIPMNITSDQTLKRIMEPSGITDDEQSVLQYDQVMDTNIAANYSICLDLIYRARNDVTQGKALDLCSGPGHFALSLKKYLGYKDITGLDLSEPMIKVANDNISKYDYKKDEVIFRQANVTDLSAYNDKSFDLVSFTNSAHHFEKLQDINKILCESERVVKEDGLVILTDLGRLKTSEITESFVRFAGREFMEKRMDHMYRDFYNSMFAAWLPQELKTAIPENTDRTWVHLVPKGLCCFQAIIGLPLNRTALFTKKSFDWENSGLLKSPEAKNDLFILQQAIGDADLFVIEPRKKKIAA